MKKYISNIVRVGLVALSVGLLLGACSKSQSNNLVMDEPVTINAFTVMGVEGVIDDEAGTVTVMVPYGTDLSALAPVIELPENATVSPASGVTQNFTFSSTSPVEYTVYNGNLYNTYRVVVREVRAEITSFRIGDKSGNINQSDNTIEIYLPEGTDVTALIPMIEYTAGATISPEIGSPMDFTDPVTYTLTHQGETFAYTVTVILGDEPKLPLVIYNGENILQDWEVLGDGSLNPSADNPKQDGVNTTLRCVSFTRAPNGEGWHGGALFGKVDIDPTEYDRFSVMVLKDVPGEVQIEIQSAGDTNKDWLRMPYPGPGGFVGEWQELIFEIPSDRSAIINTILVMPHEHGNDDANFPPPTTPMYWDELKALPKE